MDFHFRWRPEKRFDHSKTLHDNHHQNVDDQRDAYLSRCHTRTCRREKCTGIGRPFLASHRRQDSVLYNDRPQGLCVVRSLLFALTGPLLNYSTATSHDLCWLHTYLRGSFHYDLQFYYILACLHSRMPPLLFSSPPLNCYAQRVLPLTRSQFLLSFKFVLIE